MIPIRKLRFYLLLLKELSRKYTIALVLGLFTGFIVSIGFWRLVPHITNLFPSAIQRIGIIGEYTPSSLPQEIQNLISIGLTRVDESGLPLPALASSWEATDSGKTWIFHLDSGKKWHSGKSVKATDINYNVKSVVFTPLDEATLRVDMTSAYSPFPTLVAKPIFLPGLAGINTYRVARIRLKGNTVTTLRLTSSQPKDPVIEYTFFRTENMAKLAYKLGVVDTLRDITQPEDLQIWGKNTLRSKTLYNRIVTVFFNTDVAILSDKSTRQALAYALPEIPEEYAFSPLSKLSWAYTDNVKKYVPDLEKAKELFIADESSSSANLTITTFAPYLTLAQEIANQWLHLGIRTNVRVENYVPSDYQVLLTAQDIPPDPDQYPFWHSTQTATNITKYSNVKIDKLLEDGRQSLDQQERKDIYADFQRRLTDDVPAVFWFYPKNYTISRGK